MEGLALKSYEMTEFVFGFNLKKFCHDGFSFGHELLVLCFRNKFRKRTNEMRVLWRIFHFKEGLRETSRQQCKEHSKTVCKHQASRQNALLGVLCE